MVPQVPLRPTGTLGTDAATVAETRYLARLISFNGPEHTVVLCERGYFFNTAVMSLSVTCW